MWSTIANLKENLNKMAQDVHDDEDDDEEYEIYAINGSQASSLSDRRNSHSFAHSKSPSRSPIPNGIDFPFSPEIEKYKAEIKRLQESEAEIKALSKSYAVLLKEKEDQTFRLSKENGLLKQNLDSTTASLNASRNENHKAAANGVNVLKGSSNQLPNRQHKVTSPAKIGHSGHQKQNGVVHTQDDISNGISQLSDIQGSERELADLQEENNRSPAAVPATAEMKKLRMELEKERNQSENMHQKLQEQQKLNKEIQEELKFLKLDREKEHLEGDLSRAREESAKLSRLLKEADHQAEASKKEKEEILSKLSQAEKIVVDWKSRVNKLEEDNAKLRRAVEQSMTRLNRMSVDSDYLVDRRIVIKLLVTYFQRNHSKEVLDLMARMLGFSDEDKQRIGVSQGAGKGVVRGVFSLPGRLVGGILGGSSAGLSANAAADNQSFADLWVDFLLKETEERERRELADGSGRSDEDSYRTPSKAHMGPDPNHRTTTSGSEPGFSRSNISPIQNTSSAPFGSNFREHSDSEFSTVPLTWSESNPYASRMLPRY
ncbi:hypothetical protein C1H46_013078 [Malus baccata]|uniref:GRIP domain-containing protein n=1 Tax=Malus baccata TaxID=106549 RepID=A0A540MRA6_MALBA|nr:hypothetical protein C1H46_013078 [Malus baccata]